MTLNNDSARELLSARSTRWRLQIIALLAGTYRNNEGTGKEHRNKLREWKGGRGKVIQKAKPQWIFIFPETYNEVTSAR